MKKKLQVSPLDPILIRDGRPFDALPGIRAHTLNDVLPNTFAGSIRTALIKKTPTYKEELKYLDVRGPLYRWKDSLYFPIPQDLELGVDKVEATNEDQLKITRVQPQKPPEENTHSGCWGIGAEGLLEDKLWLPIGSGSAKKWKEAPAYVSEEWMLDWLTESSSLQDHSKKLEHWADPKLEPSSEDKGSVSLFMKPFAKEERTHTAIDSNTYSVKEGMLFSTESLVFPEGLKLEAWIEQNQNNKEAELNLGIVSELHTLGGKRRLVHLHETQESSVTQSTPSFWDFPKDVEKRLKNQKYIRMVLATPAYFRRGWIPGWLDENLVSKKDSNSDKNLWKSDVKLRLRWACIPRSQPVSGWAYDLREKNGEKLPQERMVRRMVPAGSVYFFEVLDEGDPSKLAEELWLQSVSDRNRRSEAHDREDGFGLALWGSWNPANAETDNNEQSS